jgi:hypothetical protein
MRLLRRTVTKQNSGDLPAALPTTRLSTDMLREAITFLPVSSLCRLITSSKMFTLCARDHMEAVKKAVGRKGPPTMSRKRKRARKRVKFSASLWGLTRKETRNAETHAERHQIQHTKSCEGEPECIFKG